MAKPAKIKAKQTKQAKQAKADSKSKKKVKVDVDKALEPMRKKALQEAKNLKKALSITKKVIKAAKTDTKKEKEAQAPAVHTQSRTDKSKMPSILTSKAYLEFTNGLDTVEKKLNISNIDMTVGGHVINSISTGILSLDFNLGGGYQPGRLICHPGVEKAGKSTGIVTSLANATAQNIPSILCDAENAFDASYADRAMARFGYSMSKMTGVYDKKNKVWEVPPMVRVRQENNGEQVFNYIQRAMRLMPIIRKDTHGNFWAVTQTFNKDGSVKKEDAVENDGVPQMFFYIDGFAALIPDILDSDDEKNTMGAQALMFTKKLPKTCRLLQDRNCVLVGSNQLRDKIGGFSMPGRPPQQTQPGGNALRFYTSIRTFFKPCAPTTAGWTKSDTEYVEEQSIYGGVDKYAYTMFKNNKHKAFTPGRTSFARIRVQHNNSGGDGYDESFDVFTYLESTGQASKRGQTVTTDIQPTKAKGGKSPTLPLNPRASWLEFKRAVEAKENKHALFEHCRAQIKSGYAFDLERERVLSGKIAAVASNDE